MWMVSVNTQLLAQATHDSQINTFSDNNLQYITHINSIIVQAEAAIL